MCVVLLSTLLRLALTLSGLTSLDDRRGAYRPVPRGDVLDAFDDAHRSLMIATGAVAVTAAAAGLGALTRFDGWTAALAGLLAVVLASRARMFPLVPQKGALLTAALVLLIALALRCADGASWGTAPALAMLLAWPSPSRCSAGRSPSTSGPGSAAS